MIIQVPQANKFNQGIWERTEAITTCHRGQGIQIFGGVIYNNTDNDFFTESHGILTPDFMWKVLLTDSNKVISWIFPNNNDVGDLDSYLVSVELIESQLIDGIGAIPIYDWLKNQTETKSWACPKRLADSVDDYLAEYSF